MPLTSPRAMFERAYKEGYAIGAFNVNNMEIIQGIMEAGTEEKASSFRFPPEPANMRDRIIL